MNILFLYSEIGAFNIPVFKLLSSKGNLHVVKWDKKILKPYTPPNIKNVTYYNRSEYDKDSILNLAKKIEPSIVYISGWMDKSYFKTVKYLKNKDIPIVTGFDDIWIGSLRQKVGSLYFKYYLSKFYTHAWVAGTRQYEFAKNLGFKDDKIIYDLLSCDYNLFNSKKINLKEKSFLYVGNFRTVKGTDILINAFREYRDIYNGDWTLTCVGNGELKDELLNEKNVFVYDFQPQDKLLEIASDTSVFILPSRHDQWGVVVHEFATLGMPLLLSENVGAKNTFLIENYNGKSYKNNSDKNLALEMFNISNKSLEELQNMGENSKKLASRITPETSVMNFLSIVEDKKYV